LFSDKFNFSVLIYLASRHGFQSLNFHQNCDFRGPTITLVQTTTGQIFGGFTRQNWQSTDNLLYLADEEAFLFSVDKQQKFSVVKKEKAILNHRKYGPMFGEGTDFSIYDNSNKNTESYSNFGDSYSLPADIEHETDEAREYLAGAYYFQTKEIEVYALNNI